jgi:pimeloyl-ACP methyl ester carboxylesterase
MDYNRPLNASKDNQKVHIALSMIPGAGHIETGQYSTSPLLVNPGGPGGSGTAFVLGIGKTLQSIVSSNNSQDVVGFDPRGVGATTPNVDCWAYPSDGKETSREDAKTGAFKQMICKLQYCFSSSDIGFG